MKRIGPYVDEGELARGGMGVIRTGFDPRLRRRAAVKLLAEGKEENAERVRRFVAEAQITGQLEHPNIVPVYALEPASDGTPAYAMKLVVGRTLEDLIDEGGLDHVTLRLLPDIGHNMGPEQDGLIGPIDDAVLESVTKWLIEATREPTGR